MPYSLGKLFTSGEAFSQRTRDMYVPLEGEQVYFVPDAMNRDESFELLAESPENLAQGAGKGMLGLLVIGTVAMFGWLIYQSKKLDAQKDTPPPPPKPMPGW